MKLSSTDSARQLVQYYSRVLFAELGFMVEEIESRRSLDGSHEFQFSVSLRLHEHDMQTTESLESFFMR